MVVTIKPLHALVAQVMAGVGSPELLVKGAASPHSYALKPSEARALNNADLLFRMSETVEAFMVKVAKSLPQRVELVTLQDAPGMKLLALRTGATFEPHAHGKGRSMAISHAKPAARARPSTATPGSTPTMPRSWWIASGRRSPRDIQSTPPRSRPMPRRSRQGSMRWRPSSRRDLGPIADKPYIVFHDAFQYLERRFGLNVVGSISINPDVPPSAKRLTELAPQDPVSGRGVRVRRAGFRPRLVDNLIEGTSARTGTLDAEGGSLDPGPDLYFTLMRKLAGALKGCLCRGLRPGRRRPVTFHIPVTSRRGAIV